MIEPPPWRSAPTLLVAGAAVITACGLAPERARAQTPSGELPLQPFEATPVGALPPMSLPMPASRNHNYWGFRLQFGQRRNRDGVDLLALAGGVDFQWQGGSVFGLTAGYQAGDCEGDAPECAGHALFGARARLNFLTGGPTVAALFGDNSATTTVGTEIGVGFAPDIASGVNACTVDVGVPLSVAMLQHVRLVAYATPGVVLDLDCSGGDFQNRSNFLTNVGVGVQQLGIRGLDVYVGLQNVFRRGAGHQFGISVSYVHLP